MLWLGNNYGDDLWSPANGNGSVARMSVSKVCEFPVSWGQEDPNDDGAMIDGRGEVRSS